MHGWVTHLLDWYSGCQIVTTTYSWRSVTPTPAGTSPRGRRARRAPDSAGAASAGRCRTPAAHPGSATNTRPGGSTASVVRPLRRAARARPCAAGVDRGHRRLTAVQHHSGIPLCDKGVDASEDLQLRADRGLRTQRVDRAVGAAEHQLAVGAAGDRGEVGAVLAVDGHLLTRPCATSTGSTRRASIRTRARCCRRSSPSRRRATAPRGRALRGSITVTTADSALSGPRTTNDVVAASNTTDSVRPGIGRTTPAGGPLAGGRPPLRRVRSSVAARRRVRCARRHSEQEK